MLNVKLRDMLSSNLIIWSHLTRFQVKVSDSQASVVAYRSEKNRPTSLYGHIVKTGSLRSPGTVVTGRRSAIFFCFKYEQFLEELFGRFLFRAFPSLDRVSSDVPKRCPGGRLSVTGKVRAAS